MLDRNQTVANLVLDHSECAEVFHRHRIDFCCRGNVSIEAAASQRGLDPDALVGELSEAIQSRTGSRRDPRTLATNALIAHIIETHHDYLRTALPFLRTLSSKVGRVHGDDEPQLRELAWTVNELSTMLIEHLDEEEHSLFPALTAASDGDTSVVREQLETMTEEHRKMADLLERIRAAAGDFAVPDWACNSYRTLMSELHRLERDIHTHVHLENHVLMPRFVGGRTGAQVERVDSAN